MSKIMVVEDDASLREIYSIRITAEGYDVVSAGDGEEALAMAVREKPDLILSDVMMPKISGFDMLDILRSTPETAKIKVIMMTALSAEDQRQRGERLGAEKYLVKSQVGIEDVVNAIHEVLGDKATETAAPVMTGAPAVPEAPVAPTIPAAPAGPVAPETPVVSEPAAPTPSTEPTTMAPNLQPSPEFMATEAAAPEAPAVSAPETPAAAAAPAMTEPAPAPEPALQPADTAPFVAEQQPVPEPQPAQPLAEPQDAQQPTVNSAQ